MLDNDKWRLGHRRPWWQWNVLTLAAALFVLVVLVWCRELFQLKQGVWPLCLLIVFIWLVFPVLVPQPAGKNANDALPADDESTDERKPPSLRLAVWILILVLAFQLLVGIAPLALR